MLGVDNTLRSSLASVKSPLTQAHTVDVGHVCARHPSFLRDCCFTRSRCQVSTRSIGRLTSLKTRVDGSFLRALAGMNIVPVLEFGSQVLPLVYCSRWPYSSSL